MNWEYKIITQNVTSGELLWEPELKIMGQKEWELCSVLLVGNILYYYFKRPIH